MTGIEHVRASYDAVAGRYAEEIGDELINKPIDRALYGCFAELVSDVADGRLVADVGCGPGHVTSYLAGLGLRACGIDVSPGMIDVARRRHPHVRFEVGSVDALPAADGDWAGAVAAYSLIHLDRDGRRAAIGELARVVTPGGWLLVAFHVSNADQPIGSVAHLSEWWGQPVDLDFHFIDPTEVSGGLEAAGFTVMSRTDRAPWPTTEHQSHRSYLLARRE